MTTFYLDYEGGNDAADGLSFANRWKTITSGATAARTAPGDTIRIMGSPAPTSLGINGTWTDGPLNATVAITSSTNATPIVVTRNSHGLSNGDTVIVNGHTTNTKANGVWEIANVAANTFELVGSVGNGVGGATGTFRKINNCRVTLASAVTAAIACLGNQGYLTNWTASANVTCSINTTDYKEGGECQQIAVAAGFTTGLAAYLALPLLTDYSGYQQVSFWIKQTAGTVAVAGDISLRLCTDTVGAVSVNTIAVPALGGLNQWHVFTVDYAGALSALAQSVALYVDTDRGAQTFLVDAVIACKASSSADSLSNTSLIGKNTGSETWWGIQSINGTRVMLDRDTNCFPGSAPQRGYSGTTETVTAYKRETIKLSISSAGADSSVQEAGTSGSLISYEGGWDRAAMTTQNLETWFDGQNGLFSLTNSRAFTSFNYISFCRLSGLSASAADNVINNIAHNNCGGSITCAGARTAVGTIISVSSVNGVTFSGAGITATSATVLSSNNIGITLSGQYVSVTTAVSKNNSGNGVNISATNGQFTSLTCTGNASSPLALTGNFCAINSATLSVPSGVSAASISAAATVGGVISGGSSTGGSSGVTLSTGVLYLRNFTVNEATEVSGWTAYANGKIFSEKHDGTADNHQIFCDGGLISSTTAQRHTASDIAWALQPTSTNRSATYPLSLSLGKYAVAASALVTVTLWTRRTNTGLTLKLVCKGGQIGGVAADVTASSSEAADTWGGDGAAGPLSITFTPSEAGVVEITAEAYGGTTYTGYVDDISVTQA